MIYFSSLKYGEPFNTGFFLKDGPNIGDISTFSEGDQVVLHFDVTKAQFESINNIAPSAGVRAYEQPGGKTFYVVIQFRVFKRRRALFYNAQRRGELQEGGYSIYLQAENGYWEDVFKWVVMGEKPIWADEESEENG